jgi:hypothetical protein
METILKHRLLSAFLFVAIFLTTARSQTEIKAEHPKKLFGGFGHLSFSGEQLNLNSFNKVLVTNKYDVINLYSPSFGGAGSYVINNFVIGGGGAWLMHAKSQNSGNTVNLKGSYGYLNLGYILYSRKHAFLFPAIGVGGGGYSIIVSKKDSPEDFSQQLNSPNGMITMNAGGWMIHSQLCYHYFLSKGDLQGYCLGIKAGYKYSPYNWNVSMNNTSLTNSPEINMNGFYLSFLIGGGGLSIN